MSTDPNKNVGEVSQQSNFIKFNDDSTLIRHAPGECAVLLVTFNSPENLQPLNFTWTSNDRPLDNPKHFRITETNSSVQLAIDHIQREDAGIYTLYARTKTGETARRDIELIVEDRSSGEDPPVFLRRLSDLSVKVGTRTRLLVEIRSSTYVKTTWYRNDRRICENDRIRSVNEGNFHCIEIAPVTLEDGGCWMIQAENLGGRNSCLALISVLVPKAYKGPEFIEALRAVLTEQGTVSLECKVIGVPTPNLRWFKDSKEIKAGDVFALTANPDDPTSLGTYTCEAVNCMGKVYSSSKVHVVGRGSREGSLKPADNILHNSPPPIFSSELKNLSIRIGETVVHGCQVVVPPWPKSVVWYNKEGRIDHNEKYRLIEDGMGAYMLEVKPSEFCDEGEWKCVVTSSEGSVGISTGYVTMDIPKNYRKPRFMESLKAVLTDEGLVSFECKVVGFPTPVLRWEKDKEELRPGDIYQLTGTNSLGTYCCIAKNCMGETSSTALLTLEDIRNQLSDEEKLTLTKLNQPPKFLQGLKSQEAKINEEFKFSVLVTATTTDPPVISWYRDELPIESTERYVIVRESAGSCQLEIRRVEFVDQAEWKCVAINDFGSSVTSSFLKLQIPKHYKKPRFLECLRAVMSDEGIVNLECKVIGVPQPVLKWFKDGVPLQPGDIHRIISGQDGTCCLGTYTCEARNCMGVVASSASLLGFDNAPAKAVPPNQDIQRNLSLSTINEERTSQMYDTPAGDITIDEKGDVSFSFDGKEVSVSLYETPDLTEEEALQIVEMYADQISEHVTEHNIVELPPLRFVKETQQSGNLLMEAVVIDVDPDYFTHIEDLRTEADMDDISIMEVSLHGLNSLKDEASALDRETEEYVQRTLNSMEESLNMKRRMDSLDQDEYFSLSHSKHSRADSRGADDTETDLQTFESASSNKNADSEEAAIVRSKVIGQAIQDTEKLLAKDANLEFDDLPVRQPRKRKDSKISDTDGSKSRDEDAILRDISGEEGDGLKLKQIPSSDVVTDPAKIQQNLSALIPLAISINIIHKLFDTVEEEVVMQSALMMSPASAGGSLKIIRNLSEPLNNFQRKLNVYSGQTSLDNLFASLSENLKDFHQGISLIEKCVSMDEEGHTMVQRTSVCVVDSAGNQILKALNEIQQIVSSFKQSRLKKEFELIIDDMTTAIQITQDTIKSQSLMQEASELEAAQHFTDTIVRLQETVEIIPFEQVSNATLPPEADPLKNVCRPVVKIQQALESIEHDLSLEENEEQLFSKVHETILQKLSEPINELQAEITKIEKSIDTVVKDSLEEKISIAILDTVCPPMYELQKGLNALSQQSPSNTHSGIISVSVLESMMPPLQEIQNGLARLGQDVESGSLERDSPTDNIDANRLLQTFAQSVLYFQNNIEALSEKAPIELRSNMMTMKNYLSKLIETVVESGMGRYNMTILENIRKPVDDLNYCLRQIEERSMSGSMKDLIEPLSVFKEKAKRCEDIVVLTGRGKGDPCLKVLKNIQHTICSIEKDIEKNELLRQQKRKPMNETLAILDELQECIASIREHAPKDQVSTLTDPEDITLLKSLTRPLEDIQKCLLEIKEVTAFDSIKKLSDSGDLDALKKIAQPLQDVVDSLRIVTQENVVDPLRSISSMDPISGLKSLAHPLQELHNCIGLIQQKSLVLDVAASLESFVPSLKVARPLTELQNCIGKILQHIFEPLEDMSTMDDISALKTSADLAQDYAENVVETHQALAIENIGQSIASAEDNDLTRANTMIEELKEYLATVQDQLVFENVENLPRKREAIAAFIKPIEELEKCIASIQQHDVHDAVDSISVQTNPSSLKILLQPLQVLEMNIAKIQRDECFTQIQTLQDLASNISELQAYISEQVQDITECFDQATEAHSNTVQDLQQCIASINQPNIMEALESLSSQTNLSDLKTLIKPIQELQRCLEINEQMCMQEANEFNAEENLSMLKTMATPLLELKQSIATIDLQTKLDVVEALSQREDIKRTAKPVLDLLECVNNINVDALEHLSDLSNDDISGLKTWANFESEAKYFTNKCVVFVPEPKVSREDLTLSLENLNKCIESLQRQPSIEFSKEYFDENNEVLDAVAQPLEQVKQALLTIQEEQHVDLEHVLESVTGPLLVLKETIEHLQTKLQNQELVEPITDLQTSLEVTLDNIAETSPANIITGLLQRPRSEIQTCLKIIQETPVLHNLHVNAMVEPLVCLQKSIEKLEESMLAKPSSEMLRSNPELQCFMASIQKIESQLYFIQTDIMKVKTPLAAKISDCIIGLKTQIGDIQNILQETEIVQPLNVAKAIQSVAVPVQSLSELINEITVTPIANLEQPVIYLKSNIKVIKDLSLHYHEALIQPLEKLEHGVLLIQQLINNVNAQERHDLLVSEIKKSLAAVISEIDGVQKFSNSLTMSLIDVKDQIVQMERTLNDSKIHDGQISTEVAKNIVKNIEKLAPLIESISKKLPVEEIKISLKEPNKAIENLIATIKSKNLSSLVQPLDKLQISFTNFECLVTSDPSQGLPKTKKEIKDLTMALKETVKALSTNFSRDEISEPTLNLLNKLTKIQNLCQQNVTVDPLQFTKLIAEVTEPLKIINGQLNTSECVDMGTKEVTAIEVTQQFIENIAEVEVPNVQDSGECEMRIFVDDQSTINNINTNIDVIEICDSIEQIVPTNVPEDTAEFTVISDDKIIDKNDNVEEDTNFVKQKLEIKAQELIRKSEERELTPEEKDSLMTLLAKINFLSSKVHKTIIDAKIINENTADIITQLKEDAETHEELKKNVNFENASGDTLGSIIDEGEQEIVNENEIIGKKKIVKISGETSIGSEEVKLVATLDVKIEEIENYVKETDEDGRKKFKVDEEKLEEIQSQTLNLSDKTKNDEQRFDTKDSGLRKEEIQSTKQNVEEDKSKRIENKEALDHIEATLQNTVSEIDLLLTKIQETPRFRNIDLKAMTQPLTDLAKTINCLSLQIINDQSIELKRNNPVLQKLIEALQGIESQLYFIHTDLVKNKMPETTYFAICVADIKSHIANVQTCVQDCEISQVNNLAEMIKRLDLPIQKLTNVILNVADDSVYSSLDAPLKHIKYKIEEIKKLSLEFSRADLLIQPVEDLQKGILHVQELIIAEIVDPIGEDKISYLNGLTQNIQMQINNAQEHFSENLVPSLISLKTEVNKMEIKISKVYENQELNKMKTVAVQLDKTFKEIEETIDVICKKLSAEQIIVSLAEPRRTVDAILDTIRRNNIEELRIPFANLQRSLQSFENLVVEEPLKAIPKNTVGVKELTSSLKETVKCLSQIFTKGEISKPILDLLDKIRKIQSFVQQNSTVETIALSRIVSTIVTPLIEINHFMKMSLTTDKLTEFESDIHQESQNDIEQITEIAEEPQKFTTAQASSTENQLKKIEEIETKQPPAVFEVQDVLENITDKVKIAEAQQKVSTAETSTTEDQVEKIDDVETSKSVTMARVQDAREQPTDKVKIGQKVAVTEISKIEEQVEEIETSKPMAVAEMEDVLKKITDQAKIEEEGPKVASAVTSAIEVQVEKIAEIEISQLETVALVQDVLEQTIDEMEIAEEPQKMVAAETSTIEDQVEKFENIETSKSEAMAQVQDVLVQTREKVETVEESQRAAETSTIENQVDKIEKIGTSHSMAVAGVQDVLEKIKDKVEIEEERQTVTAAETSTIKDQEEKIEDIETSQLEAMAQVQDVLEQITEKVEIDKEPQKVSAAETSTIEDQVEEIKDIEASKSEAMPQVRDAREQTTDNVKIAEEQQKVAAAEISRIEEQVEKIEDIGTSKAMAIAEVQDVLKKITDQAKIEEERPKVASAETSTIEEQVEKIEEIETSQLETVALVQDVLEQTMDKVEIAEEPQKMVAAETSTIEDQVEKFKDIETSKLEAMALVQDVLEQTTDKVKIEKELQNVSVAETSTVIDQVVKIEDFEISQLETVALVQDVLEQTTDKAEIVEEPQKMGAAETSTIEDQVEKFKDIETSKSEAQVQDVLEQTREKVETVEESQKEAAVEKSMIEDQVDRIEKIETSQPMTVAGVPDILEKITDKAEIEEERQTVAAAETSTIKDQEEKIDDIETSQLEAMAQVQDILEQITEKVEIAEEPQKVSAAETSTIEDQEEKIDDIEISQLEALALVQDVLEQTTDKLKIAEEPQKVSAAETSTIEDQVEKIEEIETCQLETVAVVQDVLEQTTDKVEIVQEPQKMATAETSMIEDQVEEIEDVEPNQSQVRDVLEQTTDKVEIAEEPQKLYAAETSKIEDRVEEIKDIEIGQLEALALVQDVLEQTTDKVEIGEKPQKMDAAETSMIEDQVEKIEDIETSQLEAMAQVQDVLEQTTDKVEIADEPQKVSAAETSTIEDRVEKIGFETSQSKHMAQVQDFLEQTTDKVKIEEERQKVAAAETSTFIEQVEKIEEIETCQFETVAVVQDVLEQTTDKVEIVQEPQKMAAAETSMIEHQVKEIEDVEPNQSEAQVQDVLNQTTDKVEIADEPLKVSADETSTIEDRVEKIGDIETSQSKPMAQVQDILEQTTDKEKIEEERQNVAAAETSTFIEQVEKIEEFETCQLETVAVVKDVLEQTTDKVEIVQEPQKMAAAETSTIEDQVEEIENIELSQSEAQVRDALEQTTDKVEIAEEPQKLSVAETSKIEDQVKKINDIEISQLEALALVQDVLEQTTDKVEIGEKPQKMDAAETSMIEDQVDKVGTSQPTAVAEDQDVLEKITDEVETVEDLQTVAAAETSTIEYQIEKIGDIEISQLEAFAQVQDFLEQATDSVEIAEEQQQVSAVETSTVMDPVETIEEIKASQLETVALVQDVLQQITDKVEVVEKPQKMAVAETFTIEDKVENIEEIRTTQSVAVAQVQDVLGQTTEKVEIVEEQQRMVPVETSTFEVQVEKTNEIETSPVNTVAQVQDVLELSTDKAVIGEETQKVTAAETSMIRQIDKIETSQPVVLAQVQVVTELTTGKVEIIEEPQKVSAAEASTIEDQGEKTVAQMQDVLEQITEKSEIAKETQNVIATETSTIEDQILKIEEIKSIPTENVVQIQDVLEQIIDKVDASEAALIEKQLEITKRSEVELGIVPQQASDATDVDRIISMKEAFANPALSGSEIKLMNNLLQKPLVELKSCLQLIEDVPKVTIIPFKCKDMVAIRSIAKPLEQLSNCIEQMIQLPTTYPAKNAESLVSSLTIVLDDLNVAEQVSNEYLLENISFEVYQILLPLDDLKKDIEEVIKSTESKDIKTVELAEKINDMTEPLQHIHVLIGIICGITPSIMSTESEDFDEITENITDLELDSVDTTIESKVDELISASIVDKTVEEVIDVKEHIIEQPEKTERKSKKIRKSSKDDGKKESEEMPAKPKRKSKKNIEFAESQKVVVQKLELVPAEGHTTDIDETGKDESIQPAAEIKRDEQEIDKIISDETGNEDEKIINKDRTKDYISVVSMENQGSVDIEKMLLSIKSTLQIPIIDIEKCLSNIQEISRTTNPELKVLTKPLTDLKKTIEILSNQVSKEQFIEMNKNSTDVQKFLSSLQGIESKLYFAQIELAQHKSPVPTYIATCLLEVKSQLVIIQSSIDDVDIAQTINVAKTVETLSKPMLKISEILARVNEESPYGILGSSVNHLQSKLETIKRVSMDNSNVEQLINPVNQLHKGLMAVQEFIIAEIVGPVEHEKVEKLVNAIGSVESQIDAAKESLSNNLLSACNDLQKEMCELNNILVNNAKDPAEWKAVGIQLTKYIIKSLPILDDICKKLPAENIIASLKESTLEVESLAEIINRINVEQLNEPVKKLQRSIKSFETIAIAEPTQSIPKNAKEIKTLTASLKETVKNLTQVFPKGEITKPILELLEKVGKIQSYAQQNVSVEPVYFSKVLSSIALPLKEINNCLLMPIVDEFVDQLAREEVNTDITMSKNAAEVKSVGVQDSDATDSELKQEEKTITSNIEDKVEDNSESLIIQKLEEQVQKRNATKIDEQVVISGEIAGHATVDDIHDTDKEIIIEANEPEQPISSTPVESNLRKLSKASDDEDKKGEAGEKPKRKSKKGKESTVATAKSADTVKSGNLETSKKSDDLAIESTVSTATENQTDVSSNDELLKDNDGSVTVTQTATENLECDKMLTAKSTTTEVKEVPSELAEKPKRKSKKSKEPADNTDKSGDTLQFSTAKEDNLKTSKKQGDKIELSVNIAIAGQIDISRKDELVKDKEALVTTTQTANENQEHSDELLTAKSTTTQVQEAPELQEQKKGQLKKNIQIEEQQGKSDIQTDSPLEDNAAIKSTEAEESIKDDIAKDTVDASIQDHIERTNEQIEVPEKKLVVEEQVPEVIETSEQQVKQPDANDKPDKPQRKLKKTRKSSQDDVESSDKPKRRSRKSVDNSKDDDSQAESVIAASTELGMTIISENISSEKDELTSPTELEKSQTQNEKKLNTLPLKTATNDQTDLSFKDETIKETETSVHSTKTANEFLEQSDELLTAKLVAHQIKESPSTLKEAESREKLTGTLKTDEKQGKPTTEKIVEVKASEVIQTGSLKRSEENVAPPRSETEELIQHIIADTAAEETTDAMTHIGRKVEEIRASQIIESAEEQIKHPDTTVEPEKTQGKTKKTRKSSEDEVESSEKPKRRSKKNKCISDSDQTADATIIPTELDTLKVSETMSNVETSISKEEKVAKYDKKSSVTADIENISNKEDDKNLLMVAETAKDAAQEKIDEGRTVEDEPSKPKRKTSTKDKDMSVIKYDAQVAEEFAKEEEKKQYESLLNTERAKLLEDALQSTKKVLETTVSDIENCLSIIHKNSKNKHIELNAVPQPLCDLKKSIEQLSSELFNQLSKHQSAEIQRQNQGMKKFLSSLHGIETQLQSIQVQVTKNKSPVALHLGKCLLDLKSEVVANRTVLQNVEFSLVSDVAKTVAKLSPSICQMAEVILNVDEKSVYSSLDVSLGSINSRIKKMKSSSVDNPRIKCLISPVEALQEAAQLTQELILKEIVGSAENSEIEKLSKLVRLVESQIMDAKLSLSEENFAPSFLKFKSEIVKIKKALISTKSNDLKTIKEQSSIIGEGLKKIESILDTICHKIYANELTTYLVEPKKEVQILIDVIRKNSLLLLTEPIDVLQKSLQSFENFITNEQVGVPKKAKEVKELIVALNEMGKRLKETFTYAPMPQFASKLEETTRNIQSAVEYLVTPIELVKLLSEIAMPLKEIGKCIMNPVVEKVSIEETPIVEAPNVQAASIEEVAPIEISSPEKLTYELSTKKSSKLKPDVDSKDKVGITDNTDVTLDSAESISTKEADIVEQRIDLEKDLENINKGVKEPKPLEEKTPKSSKLQGNVDETKAKKDTKNKILGKNDKEQSNVEAKREAAVKQETEIKLANEETNETKNEVEAKDAVAEKSKEIENLSIYTEKTKNGEDTKSNDSQLEEKIEKEKVQKSEKSRVTEPSTVSDKLTKDYQDQGDGKSKSTDKEPDNTKFRYGTNEPEEKVELKIGLTRKSKDDRPKIKSKKKPIFESHLTNRTTGEGTPLKLVCSYSGSDAKVIWLKNGTILRKDPRYIINDSDGIVSLQINTVSVDDSGTYFCVVNNENGEIETSCTVTVFKNVEDEKIEEKSKSQMQSVLGKHDVHQNILEKSKPNNEITKPNLSESNEVTTESNISDTKIESRQDFVKGIEDSGVKKLRADQKTRESKRKPTFDSRLTNRTTAAGSPVKLTCSYSGSNVKVVWMKDGNQIAPGSKCTVYEEDGLSALEILQSTVQDSGIYLCIARNSNGEIETSSVVTIYEKAPQVLTSPPIFSSGIRGEFIIYTFNLVTLRFVCPECTFASIIAYNCLFFQLTKEGI